MGGGADVGWESRGGHGARLLSLRAEAGKLVVGVRLQLPLHCISIFESRTTYLSNGRCTMGGQFLRRIRLVPRMRYLRLTGLGKTFYLPAATSHSHSFLVLEIHLELVDLSASVRLSSIPPCKLLLPKRWLHNVIIETSPTLRLTLKRVVLLMPPKDQ